MLSSVQWHVTNLCRGLCTHCYQDDFSSVRDLPPDTLRRITDLLLADAPPESVSFTVTGGEPLLWPHLLPFLQDLASRPACHAIDLVTSGLTHNTDIIRSLGRIPRIRTIKLSVESWDSHVNDTVRGPGHLAALQDALPLWTSVFRGRVALMLTLGRHNLPTLERTIPEALRAAPAGLILERFIPLGKGRSLHQEALTETEWLETGRRIADLTGYDPNDLAGRRAFWLRYRTDGSIEPLAADCQLGPDSMAILPDGTVLPCRRFLKPVGKLLRDPLPEILGRLAAVAAQTQARACQAASRARENPADS